MSMHRVSDSDDLTDRWGNDEMCRFAEIPADELGQMISEELVKRVSIDRAFCEVQGRPFEIILLMSYSYAKPSVTMVKMLPTFVRTERWTLGFLQALYA